MEERVNRRSFLQKAAIGGGGLLIFTAGGLAWRAWDRGSLGKIYEGTAFEPWEDWRNNRFKGPSTWSPPQFSRATRTTLSPGCFASMSGGSICTPICRAACGSIDPFLREMYIGLGCALENLMVAARGRGYEPRLVLFPSGGKQSLVARVELKPGAPLKSRITARSASDTRIVRHTTASAIWRRRSSRRSTSRR